MTFKEGLAVALFGSWCFLVLPSSSYSCDCVWFAYKALQRINIRLHVIPAIVWTTERSSYRRNVVSIHANAACMEYVHEFIHHDQYEHGLEALHQGDAMWYGLEKAAEKLTRDAMEHESSCAKEDE